jgi:PBP1b-binding outer membrane lipoprotein LpoB
MGETMKKTTKTTFLTAAVMLLCAIMLAACAGMPQPSPSPSPSSSAPASPLTPPSLTKLAQVTNLAFIDATDKISFTAVPHASGYIIGISGTGITAPINQTVTPGNGLTEASGKLIYTPAGLIAGSLSISVTAMGNNAEYSNSDPQTTVAANTVSPSLTPLTAVLQSSIEYTDATDTISFTPVANATAYIISVTGGAGQNIVNQEMNVGSGLTSSDGKLHFVLQGATAGEFNISVVVKGDGVEYGNSPETTKGLSNTVSQTAQQLQTPSPEFYDVGNANLVRWAEVANASGYKISVSGAIGTPLTDVTVPTSALNPSSGKVEYQLSSLSNGALNISVTAIGNGTSYTNSTAATITPTNGGDPVIQSQLAQPTSPSFTDSNNKIMFISSTNATGYKIKVTGTGVATPAGGMTDYFAIGTTESSGGGGLNYLDAALSSLSSVAPYLSLKNGNLTIYLIATDSNGIYADSDPLLISNQPNTEALSAPTALEFDDTDNLLIFTPPAHVGGYKIKITGAGITPAMTAYVDVLSSSLSDGANGTKKLNLADFGTLGNGSLNISLQANDGTTIRTNYNDSDDAILNVVNHEASLAEYTSPYYANLPSTENIMETLIQLQDPTISNFQLITQVDTGYANRMKDGSTQQNDKFVTYGIATYQNGGMGFVKVVSEYYGSTLSISNYADADDFHSAVSNAGTILSIQKSTGQAAFDFAQELKQRGDDLYEGRYGQPTPNISGTVIPLFVWDVTREGGKDKFAVDVLIVGRNNTNNNLVANIEQWTFEKNSAELPYEDRTLDEMAMYMFSIIYSNSDWYHWAAPRMDLGLNGDQLYSSAIPLDISELLLTRDVTNTPAPPTR